MPRVTRSADQAAEGVIVRVLKPYVRTAGRDLVRPGTHEAPEAGAHDASRAAATGAARVSPRRGLGAGSRGSDALTAAREQPIPDAVQRLPSGRLPANWKYAGEVYDGKEWTPRLAEKYPDGVRFTDDGFPDFSPYRHPRHPDVVFDPYFSGKRRSDFDAANRRSGLQDTPLGWTWHHHQDGRTMQLIPTDIHRAVRHAGGVAISKGRSVRL